MRIATLQYQYEPLEDFGAYAKKILLLVEKLAKQKIDLLLFPEYAGYEMISFATLEKMQTYLPDYLELFRKLAVAHKIYICAGSIIQLTGQGAYNRSYFFSPSGGVEFQDKCNLTHDEIKEGILSPGQSLKIFETPWGKTAISICYDTEFPTLVRTLVEAGTKLILVPSYTSSIHGFYRVFLSARARALENQCYVAQSVLVGKTDSDITYGSACVLGPVDAGFPEDGVLALGKRDVPGELIFDLDFSKLDEPRKRGQTLNHEDWKKLSERKLNVQLLHFL
jgi:predicted amidohydrolase